MLFNFARPSPYQQTIYCSDMKPSPACSPFNSAQNEVLWSISVEYLGRIVLTDDAASHRWRHRSDLMSRIRDLTCTYDWYIYHRNINGKRTFQIEVTDLKWPHGTKWQCANSTLAISWPNHVQILSFTSMVSRQVAVKHWFVGKLAGGCSSYDVIAPWPDLVNFLPKVAQGLPP